MQLPCGIRSKPFVLGAGVAWAIAVASCMAWLLRFQMTPGQADAAVPRWPGAGAVTLAPDRPTLLMFVHPRCSCSQASLGELQQLMTAYKHHLAAQVLFFQPADQSPTWSHTALWSDAAAIPGVQPRLDPGGRLARLFGAQTSGQVLIYNPQGRLLFSGGITDGRGHFGDNPGLDAAMTAAANSTPSPSGVLISNVYGCPIHSPPPGENRP
jgi:hypothetical protein